MQCASYASIRAAVAVLVACGVYSRAAAAQGPRAALEEHRRYRDIGDVRLQVRPAGSSHLNWQFI